MSSVYLEVFFRMLCAVLIGCVIGIDRNLHGKPTGIKTMGLVALGTSLVIMASINFNFISVSTQADAISRTIQGVITGIGFLGAGVIVHDSSFEKVHGLTTAASIWVTAVLGIVCGIGSWQIAVIALTFVLALFIVGRPIERMIHRHWLDKSESERSNISAHEE